MRQDPRLHTWCNVVGIISLEPLCFNIQKILGTLVPQPYAFSLVQHCMLRYIDMPMGTPVDCGHFQRGQRHNGVSGALRRSLCGASWRCGRVTMTRDHSPSKG